MEENQINVDALLNQITNTIKDFIRIDWNIVGELSNETGILPDEIFKTLYTDRILIENIICLYNTVQNKIEAKTQEIIARVDSEEADKLLQFQFEEVKGFIRENPNDVGYLSNETGILPDEIFKITYMEDHRAINVTPLYNATQKLMKERTQEIIARNGLSEEAETIITQHLAEIKSFVKPNPNVVSSLSHESGLPADEIFRIVYTNMTIPITTLTNLHNAVQKMQEEKAEEIIERNRGK